MKHLGACAVSLRIVCLLCNIDRPCPFCGSDASSARSKCSPHARRRLFRPIDLESVDSAPAHVPCILALWSLLSLIQGMTAIESRINPCEEVAEDRTTLFNGASCRPLIMSRAHQFISRLDAMVGFVLVFRIHGLDMGMKRKARYRVIRSLIDGFMNS